MAKEHSPAFQLYVKDFLEGTAEMSNAETGAYIKLLCHQWLKEFITNDKPILIRLCNGDENGIDVALSKFKKDKKGKFKNPRLEVERKKQKIFKKNRENSGKIGAKMRWHNDIKTNNLDRSPIILPLANTMANDSSASASASAIANKQAMQAEVFQFMRNSRDMTFSDRLIENEVQAFMKKYGDKPIANVAALVGGWMKNVKPDNKKIESWQAI